MSFVYCPSNVDDGLSYYINIWIAKSDYPMVEDLHTLIMDGKRYPELKNILNPDSELKITKSTLDIYYLACHKDKKMVLDALETIAIWMSRILQK